MKIGQTLGFVLGAALIPAAAFADDPADPYAEPAPGAAPATTTTTTVVTTPAPVPAQQPPVVIVNPDPQPAPRAIVIERNPETYTVTDAWNAPVFATGALVFAGSYGASAVVAASSDHVGADRLYIPVAGPWLALNEWGDCPITEPRCDENTASKVLLVADGVFQAAGVITMLTGLVSPSTHTVVANPRAAKTEVKVRPTHNGVAVVGKF